MPERPVAHVNETIACRTFENALDERFTAQPTFQGNDYGTDYYVLRFDAEGNRLNKFEAQVKHLPEMLPVNDQLRYLLDVYRFPRSSHTVYTRLQLKKHKINTYINQLSNTQVLFVTASKTEMLYCWLNDYYDYFLRWYYKANQKAESHGIYLNSIRSFVRSDENRPYWPRTTGYVEKADALWLHEAELSRGGWFGEWNHPGTIDSITNVAFSAYFWAWNNQILVREEFDVNGFWIDITTKAVERPILFLLFSNFVGQLTPTDNMISWAEDEILNWTNAINFPVAFQILSKFQDQEKLKKLLEHIQVINGSYSLYHSLIQLILKDGLAIQSDRIEFDFYIAYSLFLYRHVKTTKMAEAQDQLVYHFTQFDYSISVPNVFGQMIRLLAEEKKLIEEVESYEALLQRTKKYRDAGHSLQDAVTKLDQDWREEDYAAK
jgi:hypothetical protein